MINESKRVDLLTSGRQLSEGDFQQISMLIRDKKSKGNKINNRKVDAEGARK